MIAWTIAEARLALKELEGRATLVPLGAALCLGVLVAWLELRAASGFALERSLHGPIFGLLFPLGCFVLTRKVLGPDLDRALQSARFGANRRVLLAGRVCGLLVAVTAFAWSLCAVALMATGFPWGPLEVARLVGVATAAAFAHGAMMVLGVSLLRFGAGLSLFLDWLLGNGTGVLALFWPRAHVRNLLGGEGPLGFGAGGSLALLMAVATSCLAVAALRTKP
jgi:hypothetical protein